MFLFKFEKKEFQRATVVIYGFAGCLSTCILVSTDGVPLW